MTPISDNIFSLLAKHFAAQTNAAEETEIAAWKNANTENEEEYTVLQKIWQQQGGEDVLEFDTDNAFAKVSAATQLHASQPKGIIRYVKYAAAAAILVTAGIFIVTKISNSGNISYTAKNDNEILLLPDSSRIVLRKNASASYPKKFRASERVVEFTGEGFFEVAKNEQQPFVVTGNKAFVKVTGTKFIFSESADSSYILLQEGSVRFGAVAEASNYISLAAGEHATVKGSTIVKNKFKSTNKDAWYTKKLIFEGTPFKQAVKELEDYYGIKIEIANAADADINSVLITTQLNNQPLSKALDELTIITGYRIEKTADNTYKIFIQ